MTEVQGSSKRLGEARALVRRNVYWALGLGLVPLPLVEVVAVTAVQVKMLKQLSDLYGVAFSGRRARTLVWSLVTGLGMAATGSLAGSLFKLVPFAGLLVGTVGVSVVAAALTQAIGDLFIMHFEAGGTLLTFDVEAMRGHFREEYERARSSVRSRDPKEPIAP
jgi:uncharacterized protein (DUF697 family)